ncbi:glycosyltransferase family 4 protein [Nostoc sp.]|uniref:glycosyltransferase family 4 protein n=1 Tax=Nostoc sp. TaxID=1180 RepID=UPI002FFA6508
MYKLITSHPSFAYKRVPINRGKIIFLPPIFTVSLILDKLLGKFYFFKSPFEWLLAVVYDWMASLRVGNPDVSISWAWASLQTIRAVKTNGGIAILEECGSCNKHQEQLLSEEYERLNLDYESKTFKKIIARELQECQEADYILCPSRYVADSLTKCGISNHKLIVIPYGVELNLFNRQPKKDKIFRVLFVGSIGVRKGLIYLFQALKNLKLDNFECLIIGSVESAFQDIFTEYQQYFTHIPRVEHSQLKEYYSNSSVFVLPSLDEGMAYVQLEAMACGLPVICTPNSGGDSVIREGEEGFIIPIRDSQAIQEKIEYLYQNPQELSRIGNNALKRAKEFTWDNYGTHLETALKELLPKKV